MSALWNSALSAHDGHMHLLMLVDAFQRCCSVNHWLIKAHFQQWEFRALDSSTLYVWRNSKLCTCSCRSPGECERSTPDSIQNTKHNKRQKTTRKACRVVDLQIIDQYVTIEYWSLKRHIMLWKWLKWSFYAWRHPISGNSTMRAMGLTMQISTNR